MIVTEYTPDRAAGAESTAPTSMQQAHMKRSDC
jgi:hypothetical protein